MREWKYKRIKVAKNKSVSEGPVPVNVSVFYVVCHKTEKLL